MVEAHMPPKGSLCWHNFDNFCSLLYCNTNDEYIKEREVSNAILNVWHKCASHLNYDSDASFGRNEQARPSLSNQVRIVTRSTSTGAKWNCIKDQALTSETGQSTSLRLFQAVSYAKAWR
ncbi:hypothetical protein H310_14782 [Aphanomyces invadans]|uniref:Uncharacterized protein n=1 Tax=Aphanomyces invadans TaxID=157072 RepID=A0A024T8U9_9STRA|nr:hypothetical protein H310_14782 [Aphanomyces invadans]ETV90438.1 hypothetical protein H310_14782 [Aphanomyces invadans]|eukprot:XP_008880933.1 hypothetical protein H310_14782 [Aphanomyces invadans]